MARRHKRRSEPESMGEAVLEALEGMGLTEQARVFQIARVWEQAVGPQIAARTAPYGFNRGVLIVKTATAAWQNELVFLKDSLIRRINEALGKPMVKDIKAQSGRVSAPRKKDPTPPWVNEAARPDDEEFARVASAAIGDDELREHFAKLVELACRYDRHKTGGG